MTHIEVENLTSDYLEGLLSQAVKIQVEAHLAACAPCRELVTDVRRVMELCRSAEDLEPPPWLISKTLLATVGEKKPTFGERLAALLRPRIQPRVAYTVAMTVFSFSIIVNAAGVNLRHLTFEDLNPFTWAHRAYRTGHSLYDRAEKFYYNLRVVYEIESRFRAVRSEPQGEEKEAPKQESPPEGSTDRNQDRGPILASIPNLLTADPDRGTKHSFSAGMAPGLSEAARRSPSQ